MKIKTLFIVLLASILASPALAQQLKTIRTYHDPWTQTRINEVYTVIANTGIKQGIYKQYDEEGDLYIQSNYVKNKLNGPYKLYRIYDENGILRDKHIVGELRTYVNDYLHGEYIQWGADKNGQRQLRSRIRYNNGDKVEIEEYHYTGKKEKHIVVTGVSKTWYADGTLESEWQVENGVQNGYAKFYDKKGNLIAEKQLINNVDNGESKTYFETGKIKSIETLKNGQNIGDLTVYYPTGTIQLRYGFEKPGEMATRTIYATNGNKKRVDTRIKGDEFSMILYDSISGLKLREAIQTAAEVKNLSLVGKSGKFFYPDGAVMSTWTRESTGDNYREEFFRKDGTLSEVRESNGDRIMYSSDGKNKESKFFSKKREQHGEKTTPYERYYPSGTVKEKGFINDENERTEFIVFNEAGTKIHSKESDGSQVAYYPSGKILEKFPAGSPVVYGYYETGELKYVADVKSYEHVYYYQTGSIEAKGVEDKKGEHVGKWYLYSASGKLSVEENGETRKPKPEEKKEHLSYLSNLMQYKK